MYTIAGASIIIQDIALFTAASVGTWYVMADMGAVVNAQITLVNI